MTIVYMTEPSLKSERPVNRAYQTKRDPSPTNLLPFVHYSKHENKTADHWHVAPINDYTAACNLGHEYANHFAQYLKDNPSVAGSNYLGAIAGDIDFSDKTCAKGYWVGFFAQLELLIVEQARRMDVFANRTTPTDLPKPRTANSSAQGL